MALSVGQTAPDFKLFNTEKQEVSLSSFKGKNVILHFFPLAFTGVCTTQLCTARDNMDVYTKLNAVVLGISVDSLFSLAEFKKQQHYNFDLLSDFNKEVIKNYGLVIENFAFGMQGVSKRAAFVLDKEGVVRYAEVTPTPGDLPNFTAIKEALESLN
ncbi:MAG: peroxiredoxin [Chitinophagales bacterium]|nr:peroxiredoxin [Chitinophagales bacterium]